MKPTRKKKDMPGDDIEDDGRPVRFEALGELTSSEVIDQVKAGMSRIAPDIEADDFDELREDAA